jgi:hypothetical protein
MQYKYEEFARRMNEAFMNPNRAEVLLKSLNRDWDAAALEEIRRLFPNFLPSEENEDSAEYMLYWSMRTEIARKTYLQAAMELSHELEVK